MAGGDLAYHLRVNKAIDRQVFIDVLVRYHGFHCLNDHAYVSFGGAFLADYRVLDSHLSLKHLISLENNPWVHKRQKFNRPSNHIECRLQDSAVFLRNIDNEKAENFVLWLDYADAGKRAVQLGEVREFVAKLPPYAVLKVTLNANADAFKGIDAHAQGDERLRQRLTAAEKQLGDYWDSEATAKDMKPEAFPRVLLNCLRRSINQGLSSRSDVVFEPITSFCYSDGQAMLTLTGALIPEASRRELKAKMGLRAWHIAYQRATAPIQIRTPVLSSRERSHFEGRLPRGSRKLLRIKQFRLGPDDGTHDAQVTAFSRFAKYYPQFSRIVP